MQVSGPLEDRDDEQLVSMLKDFVTSNLPNVEVKDEHKVLFIHFLLDEHIVTSSSTNLIGSWLVYSKGLHQGAELWKFYCLAPWLSYYLNNISTFSTVFVVGWSQCLMTSIKLHEINIVKCEILTYNFKFLSSNIN